MTREKAEPTNARHGREIITETSEPDRFKADIPGTFALSTFDQKTDLGGVILFGIVGIIFLSMLPLIVMIAAGTGLEIWLYVCWGLLVGVFMFMSIYFYIKIFQSVLEIEITDRYGALSFTRVFFQRYRHVLLQIPCKDIKCLFCDDASDSEGNRFLGIDIMTSINPNRIKRVNIMSGSRVIDLARPQVDALLAAMKERIWPRDANR